jgi:NADPH:quinone reductase-like Zn-dependent oxidoreductase
LTAARYAVRYAGVNPVDYKLLEKLTPTSTYPFVVGIDIAGVAERVPAGERDLQTGDRVFGMARTHGSYAEYTAVEPGVKAEALARIPDGVTDEQAAALPIPAITALGSLELLGIAAGNRLVVMGATGGVGSATRKLVAQLASKYGRLIFCYEAGPTGYGLYRLIKSLGHDCIVVAPSLIPSSEDQPARRVQSCEASQGWRAYRGLGARRAS